MKCAIKTTNTKNDFGNHDDDVVIMPGHEGLVTKPNVNDVLSGRGGRINNHKGNVHFRQLVNETKLKYMAKTTKKLEKVQIANQIVHKIRSMDPPGRFLKEDPKSGLWIEIGDERARKKAGQALREKAPETRRELDMIEKKATASYGDPNNDTIVSTHLPLDIPNPYKSSDANSLSHLHLPGQEYFPRDSRQAGDLCYHLSYHDDTCAGVEGDLLSIEQCHNQYSVSRAFQSKNRHSFPCDMYTESSGISSQLVSPTPMAARTLNPNPSTPTLSLNGHVAKAVAFDQEFTPLRSTSSTNIASVGGIHHNTMSWSSLPSFVDEQDSNDVDDIRSSYNDTMRQEQYHNHNDDMKSFGVSFDTMLIPQHANHVPILISDKPTNITKDDRDSSYLPQQLMESGVNNGDLRIPFKLSSYGRQRSNSFPMRSTDFMSVVECSSQALIAPADPLLLSKWCGNAEGGDGSNQQSYFNSEKSKPNFSTSDMSSGSSAMDRLGHVKDWKLPNHSGCSDFLRSISTSSILSDISADLLALDLAANEHPLFQPYPNDNEK